MFLIIHSYEYIKGNIMYLYRIMIINFDENYVSIFNCNTGTSEYPFFMKNNSVEQKYNYLNIRHQNLVSIKNVLDKYNIKWCLTGGTLLGAVRDNELILDDYDDDIWVFNPIPNELINDLIKDNFRICRYEGRYVLSFIRNGFPIDFCFMNNIYSGLYSTLEPRYSVFNFSENFFENMPTIKLRNVEYPIPNHIENFLNFFYFDTWKIPISGGVSRGQSNDPFIVFTKDEEIHINKELYNSILCKEGIINIFFI